jgi:hypothetical protein
VPRESDREQHDLLELQLYIRKAGLESFVNFADLLPEVQVRDPPRFPRAVRRVCHTE